MGTLFEIDDRDVLQRWAEAHGRRRRGAQQPGMAAPGCDSLLRTDIDGRAALLAVHDVAMRLPETGVLVDLADPNHRVLMKVLAAQPQRELVRSRHRTLAAMTAQTIEQGRFLGGRPPHRYRLVDAGPHPNRAHAAWGRPQQRLDPDPVTARHAMDLR